MKEENEDRKEKEWKNDKYSKKWRWNVEKCRRKDWR